MIQDSSFKRETAGLLTPGHFEAVDIVNDYQVLCLVTQSCLTLCNPRDCSPPGSSVHGDSLGKNTGAGCHALLQRIFPIQGLNPGLPHCRWILYHLSHQGSPGMLERVAYAFSRGIFPTQGSSWFLLHCRQILYQPSCQGSQIQLYIHTYIYVYTHILF